MSLLTNVAKKTAPRLYEIMRRSFGWSGKHERLCQVFTNRYGRRVLAGPFIGMDYVHEAAGSAYIPKLLGCYEAEIHPFLEKALQRQHEIIVDIGCAEGYYAIGLALRCPRSRIFAFDLDASARQLCQQMSELNGVSAGVTIQGFCNCTSLREIPLENSLVICDVEGYEDELLNLETVPSLEYADIIVELHEKKQPGVTSRVLSRFSKTHEMTVIDAVRRSSDEFPLLHFLPNSEQRMALMERPDGMQFAFLQAYRTHG